MRTRRVFVLPGKGGGERMRRQQAVVSEELEVESSRCVMSALMRSLDDGLVGFMRARSRS